MQIIPELRRLIVALVFALASMFFYGVKPVLMTIMLFVGVLAIAVILAHMLTKNLFGKYKWDVGAHLNEVHDEASEVEDYKTVAYISTAMLYARTAVLIAILLSLIFLVGMLLPRNATAACKPQAISMASTAEASESISVKPPIPKRAERVLPILITEHKELWPDSNICILARQIQQESAWKETAIRKESNGATSYGVLQVLDSTWYEIQRKYPTLLDGKPQQMLQAQWAIRAGILYDLMQWNATTFAFSEKDRYCMMLSAYNGGLGWLQRDRRLTEKNGKDPDIWFGNVELFSSRSQGNLKINRRYVNNIINEAHIYRAVLNCP